MGSSKPLVRVRRQTYGVQTEAGFASYCNSVRHSLQLSLQLLNPSPTTHHPSPLNIPEPQIPFDAVGWNHDSRFFTRLLLFPRLAGGAAHQFWRPERGGSEFKRKQAFNEINTVIISIVLLLMLLVGKIDNKLFLSRCLLLILPLYSTSPALFST